MRLQHCALFVMLLLVCGPVRMAAQVTGGTIIGTITDSSGAVVPSATVRVKNLATDVDRIVSTNQDGLYRTPNLLPGKYQVSVSGTGFATTVFSEVTLDVGQELQIDLPLRVGHATETVEVTAEQPGGYSVNGVEALIRANVETSSMATTGTQYRHAVAIAPAVSVRFHPEAIAFH